MTMSTYIVVLLLLLSPILVPCGLLNVRLDDYQHLIYGFRGPNTNLLLLIAQLLPPSTEQLANLAEPSIGVLSLDTFPPVLAKEHVC